MNDDTLSRKISEGMRLAAEKGVHIGRPRVFAFSEDGNLSEEDILIFAREGKSISETARAIGVNRMTLTRALLKSGILDDYKNIRQGHPCNFLEGRVQ